MWWLLALSGIALVIKQNLDQEAGLQRRRWAESYLEVTSSIQYHREKIETHIIQARQIYNFHELTNLHFSSMIVADLAYKKRADAYLARNAIQRSLDLALAKMGEIYSQTKVSNIGSEERESLHLQLQDLKKFKDSLKSDIEVLNEQINLFATDLNKFNHATHQLKHLIKERCGFRGLFWFRERERRKSIRG